MPDDFGAEFRMAMFELGFRSIGLPRAPPVKRGTFFIPGRPHEIGITFGGSLGRVNFLKYPTLGLLWWENGGTEGRYISTTFTTS